MRGRRGRSSATDTVDDLAYGYVERPRAIIEVVEITPPALTRRSESLPLLLVLTPLWTSYAWWSLPLLLVPTPFRTSSEARLWSRR